MFERAEIMTTADHPKPNRSKVIKIALCSTAAAAVLGTTTVFADEIKTAIYSFFGNDNIINENVILNIYEDSDDHLSFSVEKIVSDNISSYAIIRYTALDEYGQEWLGERFIADINITDRNFTDPDISIKPKLKEITEIEPLADYGVSYSYGMSYEVTDEQELQNTRVFRLGCFSSGDNVSTNSVEIGYIMSEGSKKTAEINVSESVPLTDIKLNTELAADRPYIPTGVKISPLSVFVYGMNNGLYDYTLNDNGLSMWSNYEGECSVEVIAKDGTAIKQSKHKSFLGAEFNPDTEYDVRVYSSEFASPVDIDNIAGINIDGVYYSFE